MSVCCCVAAGVGSKRWLLLLQRLPVWALLLAACRMQVYRCCTSLQVHRRWACGMCWTAGATRWVVLPICALLVLQYTWSVLSCLLMQIIGQKRCCIPRVRITHSSSMWGPDTAPWLHCACQQVPCALVSHDAYLGCSPRRCCACWVRMSLNSAPQSPQQHCRLPCPHLLPGPALQATALHMVSSSPQHIRNSTMQDTQG